MTLLFIHGFAAGPAVWKEQIKEFSGKFRVETETGRIGELEKVIIVGWSMGGWKAIELFLEHPSRVKGLVLVSAFAKYLKSEDYPFGTDPALLLKLERKFKGGFKAGLRYFYDLLFKGGEWLELAEKLPVPEKEDVDRWFEKLKKEDKRGILREIKVPVLIIHGDLDNIVPPKNSEYLHENIPGSDLRILPGVGHAPMVEVPELFNFYLKEFAERRV